MCRRAWDKGVCFSGKSCVNCGGAHIAGDQKCLVREREFEVAGVQVVKKMSCRGSEESR